MKGKETTTIPQKEGKWTTIYEKQETGDDDRNDIEKERMRM